MHSCTHACVPSHIARVRANLSVPCRVCLLCASETVCEIFALEGAYDMLRGTWYNTCSVVRIRARHAYSFLDPGRHASLPVVNAFVCLLVRPCLTIEHFQNYRVGFN